MKTAQEIIKDLEEAIEYSNILFAKDKSVLTLAYNIGVLHGQIKSAILNLKLQS